MNLGVFHRPALLAVAAALAGCATLPAFGPSSDQIVEAATREFGDSADTTPFDLVNLSQATLPVQSGSRARFPEAFVAQGRLGDDERIGVGDALDIRIWEAADDGLFAAAGERQTEFSVTVSNSGAVELPYAGRVEVAGLSAADLRKQLIERYRGQAIDPEIHVEIAQAQSRMASVLGAVGAPARATIPPNGIRLLDLLALVGGVPHASWEAEVAVARGTRGGRVMLDLIEAQPANNIVILPGDVLRVTHLPRRYAVYGAVARPGNVALDAPQPSLSMLLAEVGGLNDMQAEPNSVFVFRQSGQAGAVPAAYRLDFARPDAFLLADRFTLAPSDIVYVATTDASEFRKFVSTLLSPFVGSATSIQNVGN